MVRARKRFNPRLGIERHDGPMEQRQLDRGGNLWDFAHAVNPKRCSGFGDHRPRHHSSDR
jgi:hypothetical protein